MGRDDIYNCPSRVFETSRGHIELSHAPAEQDRPRTSYHSVTTVKYLLGVHFTGTNMKITYDKEPRCYMCGRSEEEVNYFLFHERKDLEKKLRKAIKERKTNKDMTIKNNRKVHDKHMEFVMQNPVNYEFSMGVILKDFDAFSRIIPDLKELVDLYRTCDKVHNESKLVDLVKVLKNYHNEEQLAREDQEIRRLENELKVLEGVRMKFQSVSTKLEYLTDIPSFDIKGTKFENMVVSVDICPNCEKLIEKFGR
ncbi:MAG: hypothetical protein JXA22_02740 [Candidatus Thermoplasmatota archaeon]|nr:hypothetical protein [Candidatus Thermoplasmatota archaeon]